MMAWKHIARAEEPEAPQRLPEERLLVAMLERAVRDLFRTDDDSAKYRRSALEWLMCADTEPFSFIHVCDVLDLPQVDLRRKILTLYGSKK